MNKNKHEKQLQTQFRQKGLTESTIATDLAHMFHVLT